MAAGEGEELRDAAVGERAGDELAAVDRAGLGAASPPSARALSSVVAIVVETI